MKDSLGLGADELRAVFDQWNRGVLDSYLIEITRDIFGVKDEDGSPLVDKILDTAGQKGTGKWTTDSALDLGMPVTLIGEATFARALSSLKDERKRASERLGGPTPSFSGDKKAFIADVERALYSSKIVSYAQGYMLLREASKEYKWDLNFGSIALMWRGGCIIRSRFLGDIKKAFDKNPKLENLLVDDFFQKAIQEAQDGWRRTVAHAATAGIPVPAMSSALAFYDGYRRERLPANLVQAQRDYFGAHTYERVDRPRGEFSHTNWTGRGGNVSSRSYNA
jgi:6-phosphogluconate dehydrogenase